MRRITAPAHGRLSRSVADHYYRLKQKRRRADRPPRHWRKCAVPTTARHQPSEPTASMGQHERPSAGPLKQNQSQRFPRQQQKYGHVRRNIPKQRSPTETAVTHQPQRIAGGAMFACAAADHTLYQRIPAGRIRAVKAASRPADAQPDATAASRHRRRRNLIGHRRRACAYWHRCTPHGPAPPDARPPSTSVKRPQSDAKANRNPVNMRSRRSSAITAIWRGKRMAHEGKAAKVNFEPA